jgi:Na+/proline symporter
VDTKRTPDGFSHYIAIPGVIQWVSAGAKAQGGAWTGMMVLTYMFALMGIQSAPAFSMWSFSNKNPRPFAPQQVWASSFGIGFILIVFTAIQGMGAHLLGADPAMLEAGYAKDIFNIGGDIMALPGGQGQVVPVLIMLLESTAPWFVGLLCVCALAAMQSTGAAYMSTAAGMLTRDLYKRFINPSVSHSGQKLFGRMGVVIITGAALVVATTSADALVLLGGLAVAYGFQMWPALIGICWWPFLTRKGVTVGLIAGIIGVTLTESIGTQWFGITAWGRWPLTMHSAAWGIYFNLGLAILVSFFTQNDKEKTHQKPYHAFLTEHAVWFFFGIGPGAVLGNTLFGNPTDASTWVFGMPSIWVWHIIWWALGVGMMIFLAYKMEMSTMPETEIVALVEDIGDLDTARLDLDKP